MRTPHPHPHPLLQIHTVFIWALALPVIVAAVSYQSYYLHTTAIMRLLTLEVWAHHMPPHACMSLTPVRVPPCL